MSNFTQVFIYFRHIKFWDYFFGMQHTLINMAEIKEL